MLLWVDVAGPPGVGKSTLCYPVWEDRAVGWDGKLPPVEWHDFCNEITRLFLLIEPSWSYEPAMRMVDRSIKKMATVHRMDPDPRGPFMQTALVQRGLGFGWRLNDLGGPIEEVRHFFRLMPVSLGVAFLTASPETIMKRNKLRLQNPETKHENRSYQVPLMMPIIDIAKDELAKRGVNIIEIDVDNQTEEESRAELVKFANESKTYQLGHSGELMSLSPVWWQ